MSVAVTGLKLSSNGPLYDLSAKAVVLYVKFTAIVSLMRFSLSTKN